jgi:hypothetical protein
MPRARDRSPLRSALAWLVFCASFLVACATERVGTEEQSLSLSATCGDGVCAPWEEDCGVCGRDCPCPGGEFCYDRECRPVCGDGVCAPWVEGCGNCGDCTCPPGYHCDGIGCAPDDPCENDPDPYCCRFPWKPWCRGDQPAPVDR